MLENTRRVLSHLPARRRKLRITNLNLERNLGGVSKDWPPQHLVLFAPSGFHTIPSMEALPLVDFHHVGEESHLP